MYHVLVSEYSNGFYEPPKVCKFALTFASSKVRDYFIELVDYFDQESKLSSVPCSFQLHLASAISNQKDLEQYGLFPTLYLQAGTLITSKMGKFPHPHAVWYPESLFASDFIDSSDVCDFFSFYSPDDSSCSVRNCALSMLRRWEQKEMEDQTRFMRGSAGVDDSYNYSDINF